jgi:plastocyanin
LTEGTNAPRRNRRSGKRRKEPMKMPRFRALLLVGASALLMAGLTACGDDDDEGNGGTNGTATEENGDNGDDDAVTEITISMKDNVFEPKDVTIPAGETVTITVKNEGTAIHNMSILETDFKSDAIVNAGAESTFEVEFDDAGEYKFQCDYHVPDMVGTITVE